MSSNRSVRAGDPFAYAGEAKAKKNGAAPLPPTRTTRHHRVDEEFVAILEEDFGIPAFALNAAFMGVPREPKKGAIALCEWAAAQDEPEKALLSWARKNGRGTFRRPDDAGDDE